MEFGKRSYSSAVHRTAGKRKGSNFNISVLVAASTTEVAEIFNVSSQMFLLPAFWLNVYDFL